MKPLPRAFASVLLAGGIVMVLAGLSAALGSTIVGAVVSTALVAALNALAERQRYRHADDE